jgi:hypothetical protein
MYVHIKDIYLHGLEWNDKNKSANGRKNIFQMLFL